MTTFRLRTLVLGALAAVAIAAPHAASAQVLYSNGVPNGLNGFALFGGQSLADDFTLGANAVVTSFQWYDLSAGTNSGPTLSADYSWTILSDASGLPGSVLASGIVTGGVGNSTGEFCCAGNNSTTGYLFDQPISPLSLTAGNYWLALGLYSDGKAGSGYWAESRAGASAISHDAGVTYSALSLDLAFSVSGTPPSESVTPEPATVTLLATGLVGMVGIGRRNRRTRNA